MQQKGYIYFLLNKSFPGLVKIGYTHRSVEKRLNELRTTGVPTPFIVGATFWVNSPINVERAIHQELNSFRVESDREFFSIDLALSLQRCFNIIQAAISSQSEVQQPLQEEPLALEKAQIWLLEFALGSSASKYNTIIDMVSSDYEIPEQIVLLNADKLVDMKLLKCVRDTYTLTPQGRALCFEDDRIWTDHVTEDYKTPS